MTPRRPRSASPTGPLNGFAWGTENLPPEVPPPHSITAQLRLPPSRRRKASRFGRLIRRVGLLSALLGLSYALFSVVPKALPAFGKLPSPARPSVSGVFAAPSLRDNILILGTDFNYENGQKVSNGAVRSDTMLVAGVDPISRKVSLISIPRDTRVSIRGHHEKINSAYALGGPKLAMEVVSDLLGVPVKHWAQVNTKGLERLVDVLGGVRIYVDKDLYYVDETAHLGINIHKGWHLMNGRQAHQYVRFRHDELGDIGRVQRQQQFLRAAADSVLTPSIVFKVPSLVNTVRSNISTNVSSSELLCLAAWGAQLSRHDVHMVMLPGEFSQNTNASYWLVDPQVARNLGQRVLAGVGPSEAHLPSRQKVKLIVLNGTARPGIAAAAARELRDAGWNILSVGDAAQRNLSQTRVINQMGQELLALRLEQDLGIKPECVDASIGDLTSDFTVIVGDDWVRAHPSHIAEN